MLGLLLAIVAWMAQEGLANNTKAMERLVCTLDRVEQSMTNHEVRLENHEVRLTKGGL